MTIRRIALLVLAGCCGAVAAAAPAKVAIVAYINQASGCQVPTETYLKNLAKIYQGRVSLEFVDFGRPKGRKRWQRDGMHCMGIKIDGSTKARIVYKGVELDVAFEMPVGHRWLHEELATAVRQKLDGVKPADRIGLTATTKRNGDDFDVVVDAKVVLTGLEKTAAETIVKTMNAAAKAKPLAQDDFAVSPSATGARFTLRDMPLYDLAKENTITDNEFGRTVVQTYLTMVKPFPRVSRPFPGLQQPQRRR